MAYDLILQPNANAKARSSRGERAFFMVSAVILVTCAPMEKAGLKPAFSSVWCPGEDSNLHGVTR